MCLLCVLKLCQLVLACVKLPHSLGKVPEMLFNLPIVFPLPTLSQLSCSTAKKTMRKQRLSRPCFKSSWLTNKLGMLPFNWLLFNMHNFNCKRTQACSLHWSLFGARHATYQVFLLQFLQFEISIHNQAFKHAGTLTCNKSLAQVLL